LALPDADVDAALPLFAQPLPPLPVAAAGTKTGSGVSESVMGDSSGDGGRGLPFGVPGTAAAPADIAGGGGWEVGSGCSAVACSLPLAGDGFVSEGFGAALTVGGDALVGGFVTTVVDAAGAPVAGPAADTEAFDRTAAAYDNTLDDPLLASAGAVTAGGGGGRGLSSALAPLRRTERSAPPRRSLERSSANDGSAAAATFACSGRGADSATASVWTDTEHISDRD
jgi:hypothetical protein